MGIYDTLDQAVFGGVLPGGVASPTETLAASAASAAQTGAIQQAVTGTALAQQASASIGRVGGKRMIAEATVYPDGTIVPRKVTRGTVKLSSADMTAYNRVRRVAKSLGVKVKSYVGKKRRRR